VPPIAFLRNGNGPRGRTQRHGAAHSKRTPRKGRFKTCRLAHSRGEYSCACNAAAADFRNPPTRPEGQEFPTLAAGNSGGGKVEFPNHDPFFHNVFSLFDGKRFDLGLYESGTTRFVQFDKPGISFIFCNIHAQMNAVVIALNTPYYAISDAHGDLSIKDVVPGRYQMHVFHPSVSLDKLHAAEREITVIPGDAFLGAFSLAESDFELPHKNKYGRDYDRPDPDSPAYARP